MKKLVSNIITRIKGEPYSLDENITGVDLAIILKDKGFQVLKGFWKGIFFKKKQGILFVGKRVKIRHANHITTDSGLTLGDDVYINALSKKGIKFGNNVSIGAGGIIECTGVIRELGEGIVIGDHVGFAQNVFISVRGEVEIGNDCIFGPNVSIHAENHVFKDVNTPIRQQGATRLGVKIGRDCWVGNGVIILDGVTIGEGCVIAANAVVNKDIPAFSIVGGVPAKVIKSRI